MNHGNATGNERQMQDKYSSPSISIVHNGPSGAGTGFPGAPRLSAGALLLGRYRVIDELGEGGMGVVYRCLDETAGIEVALKALPPEVSHNRGEMEEVRENFQLVAKLIHQNIAVCKTLERDSSDGGYYLMMELVSGEELSRWIRRRHRGGVKPTLEEILPIVRQVASALDYAHGKKVLHRDVKPGNIMLASDGEVKVLDFGLAAQLHTSMSRVSRNYRGTSGTMAYMAPEQWRGREQRGSADQYALAATVYEMLSGHPPFVGAEAAVLREAVLHDSPPPIAGLPPMAWQALERGLAKEPERRFGTCVEFVDALGGGEEAAPGTTATVEPAIPANGSGADLREEELRLRVWLERHEAQMREITDRADGFGDHLDRYSESRAVGMLAIEEKDTAHSLPALREARAEAEWLIANAPLREAARQARKTAEAAQAGAMVVSKDAEALFAEVEGIAAKAAEAFNAQRFQEAVGAWEAAAEGYRKCPGRAFVVTLPGEVPLEMVCVPAGSFQMGSPAGEAERFDDERQHRVTITEPFYIGKYPVTQEQWMAVMPRTKKTGVLARLFGGANVYPFWFCETGGGKESVVGKDTSRFPAESITWEEAKEFCERLNRDSSIPRPKGYRFDLPTEAQWEFAARGGNRSQGLRYSGGDNLDEVAWFRDNSGCGLHPVGQKWPNELGLYDMSGNVWEWCQDWYGEYGGDATDPTGPQSGQARVNRGGGWRYNARNCRAALRDRNTPSCRSSNLGFRLALVRVQ